MVAGAFQFIVLAVEEKAVGGVEADGADAELGFLAVHDLAAGFHGGDEFVESGGFGRPEDGVGHLGFQLHGPGLGAFHLFSFLEFGEGFAFGREDLALHGGFGGVSEGVDEAGLDVDLGLADGDIVFKFAGNKDAIRGDGYGGGFIQPDMAVDAGAFVEPAFELGGVDFQGNGVGTVEADDVGDIGAEGGVPAFVAGDDPAVDPDSGVAVGPVELEPDAFADVGGGEGEGAAVPANGVALKAGADGFETVAAIGVAVEGEFNGPVVGQIQRTPGLVVEFGRGGSAAGAGFVEAEGVGPVIAQVKFPVRVEG